MKTLRKVLLDLVEICEKLELRYAVMGGIAVRIHGIPRPTYDVDVTIAARGPELQALMDELEAREYTIPDSYRTGWMDRVADMPIVKARCYLEEGIRIDVDLFVMETEFQRCLSRTTETL